MIRIILVLSVMNCAFFSVFAQTPDYIALGDSAQGNNRMDSALFWMRKAVQSAETPKYKARAYYKLSGIFSVTSQLDSAIDYLSRSLEIEKKLNNKKNIAKIYNSFGNVYHELQNFKQAIDNYKMALTLFKRVKDPLNECLVLNNIGNVYLYDNQLEEAKKYYTQTTSYESKLDNKLFVGKAYSSLGSISIFQGDIPQAEKYFALGKELVYKYGTAMDKKQYMLFYASGKYNMGKYQECIDLSNKLADELRSELQLRDWEQHYLKIAYSYYELGQFDSAFMNLSKYSNSSLQLHEKKLQGEILEKLALLEVNRLEYEAQLAEEKAKRERVTKYLFLAIALITLVAAIAVYLKHRRYKREKERLSKLQLETAERTIQHSKDLLRGQGQLIVEKNRIISGLRDKMQDIQEGKNTSVDLEHFIETKILTKEDWVNFKKSFTFIYPMFIDRTKEKYAEITEAELRILCLSKLGLNKKEIADMLGVLPKSVQRSVNRFKNKVGLTKDDHIDALVESI